MRVERFCAELTPSLARMRVKRFAPCLRSLGVCVVVFDGTHTSLNEGQANRIWKKMCLAAESGLLFSLHHPCSGFVRCPPKLGSQLSRYSKNEVFFTVPCECARELLFGFPYFDQRGKL